MKTFLLLVSLAIAMQPLHAAQRDGQHDFDFAIGTWKTHLKRLVRPLTGSTTWVELEGTSVIRKVWDGRANLVEYFSREPFNGRTIYVRNAFSEITADSYRFEQSFSDDGGKTWEVNWIATDTRLKEPKG